MKRSPPPPKPYISRYVSLLPSCIARQLQEADKEVIAKLVKETQAGNNETIYPITPPK